MAIAGFGAVGKICRKDDTRRSELTSDSGPCGGPEMPKSGWAHDAADYMRTFCELSTPGWDHVAQLVSRLSIGTKGIVSPKLGPLPLCEKSEKC